MRSVCQNFHCPFTDFLETAEYINNQQRPGCFCVDAQLDLNRVDLDWFQPPVTIYYFLIQLQRQHLFPKTLPLKMNLLLYRILNEQGPVVQSAVSLTSSLRVISLTVLADSGVFFAEKYE